MPRAVPRVVHYLIDDVPLYEILDPLDLGLLLAFINSRF